MEKIQFNARVSPMLKTAADTVSAALNWTLEDVFDVALRTVMGDQSAYTVSRKNLITAKIKQLNIRLADDDLIFQAQPSKKRKNPNLILPESGEVLGALETISSSEAEAWPTKPAVPEHTARTCEPSQAAAPSQGVQRVFPKRVPKSQFSSCAQPDRPGRTTAVQGSKYSPQK